MSVLCGNCKHHHETAADVRICFQGGKPGSQEHLHEDALEPMKLQDIPWPPQEPLFKEGDPVVQEFGPNPTSEELINYYMDQEPSVENASAYYLGKFQQRVDSINEFRPEELAEPAPEPGQMEEGFYSYQDEIYKAVRSQKGHLYAKRVADNGVLEYAPGIMKELRPGMRLDIDKAKDFGHRTGRCACCGRTLTNPDSIELGIGPICASRYF